MTLLPGTRLGPYEVLASLGSGGMGEVYRARDSRLGREVAVKVLPEAYSADPDRLVRFKQEARAASKLAHPNILIIHDIGLHEGAPYIVSELLEGETLQKRLASGPLPPRKAVEYATQIAQGLAAAHEQGIVHRDLKPANLFLTKDGRIKILDFGLAKLVQIKEGSTMTVAPAETEPGLVLGTVGYMSPEQVRGQPADPRSDIFSFGAVLYEMLSGRRAFQGASAADVMSGILKEDPPGLQAMDPTISPALERVVHHCLEKDPEERFQSARDLAFDLRAPSEIATQPLPHSRPLRHAGALAAVAVVLLGALPTGFLVGRRSAHAPIPAFQRVTFRRGTIGAARYVPDGHTIVYAAAWDGDLERLFSTRIESPEASPLDLPAARLIAISRTGEMAISRRGTLARVALGGGAPREILEGIYWADWSPDGAALAVVRDQGRRRLEFPPGTLLYETGGDITHPRVSPQGTSVAFLLHERVGDDAASVAVVDLAGKMRRLSGNWTSAVGLAWAPDGDEIWFTAHSGQGEHPFRPS